MVCAFRQAGSSARPSSVIGSSVQRHSYAAGAGDVVGVEASAVRGKRCAAGLHDSSDMPDSAVRTTEVSGRNDLMLQRRKAINLRP